MDIRRFFSSSAQAKNKEDDVDRDSEQPATSKKKRVAVIEDSDSDSDFVSATPQSKKSRAEAKNGDKKASSSSSSSRLKETKPEDFFGAPAKNGQQDKKAETAEAGKAKAKTKAVAVERRSSPRKSDKHEKRDSDMEPVARPKNGSSSGKEKRSSSSSSSPKKPSSGKERESETSKSKRNGDSSSSSLSCAKKRRSDATDSGESGDGAKTTPVKESERVRARAPARANGSSKQKTPSPQRTSAKKTKLSPGEKSVKSSPAKRLKIDDEAKTASSSSSNSAPSGSSQPSSSSQAGPSEPPPPPSLLWVEKYKPSSLKQIIGQQGDKSNMRKLQSWLENWAKCHSTPGSKPPSRPPPWNHGADNGAWAKAALLSGPPGVGKTTTAYLVSRELGYDVMEMNASDTRSKKLLSALVSDAMSSQSLSKTSKKRVLLMDEVDGMAGNEDRGGMAELISLIKSSRIPVVCMCNDRNHQKIRSLANHCFDLRFQRPRAELIKSAMMSVCFKEKVKITPDGLNELIVGCNQDVRQVLHHLSLLKAKGGASSSGKMTAEEAKAEANKAKKTSIKMGPFDVVRKVFSYNEHKDMSLFDKSDLFFHDYSMGPLFTQENYLSCTPRTAEKDRINTMELVSRAADSFCSGDLIDATIRSRNSWNLLPVQAMFSSVIPGEYMSGYLSGQIQFPAWFGKYSKQNKFERILQELQVHTRLSAGLSKRALNQDFAQHLRDKIVRPLRTGGSDGAAESVQVMQEYALLREDLDNLMEVCQWPNQDVPMKAVETKAKAAFTRLYNKEIVLPYASNLGAVGRKRGAAAAPEELLADEDADGADDAEENEDEEDISADNMIKAKKPSKAKATSSKSEGGRGGKGGARGRGGGAKRGRK